MWVVPYACSIHHTIICLSEWSPAPVGYLYTTHRHKLTTALTITVFSVRSYDHTRCDRPESEWNSKFCSARSYDHTFGVMDDHTGCDGLVKQQKHTFSTSIMYDHTGCDGRSHRVWWTRQTAKTHIFHLNHVRSHRVWWTITPGVMDDHTGCDGLVKQQKTTAPTTLTAPTAPTAPTAAPTAAPIAAPIAAPTAAPTAAHKWTRETVPWPRSHCLYTYSYCLLFTVFVYWLVFCIPTVTVLHVLSRNHTRCCRQQNIFFSSKSSSKSPITPGA